ncbi:MAG: hypothetical protein HY211_06880 [Candidatus Omnitrophica bacterium]|nr:hypothetical protein [Candidatus Omnitrophota bacterium]
MRTHIVSGWLLGLGVLGFALPSWAASLEVPWADKEHRFGVEAEYAHLFGRDLKAPTGETDELTRGDASHAVFSFSFEDWLVPYGKIGAVDLKERMTNTNIVGLGRRNIDLKYDWGISWGGGVAGSARPISDQPWVVGYDIQYLRSEHDLNRVVHSGVVATARSGKLGFQEWHGGAWVGWTFDLPTMVNVQPKGLVYVGGRYSDVKAKLKSLQYTVSDPSAGLGIVSVTGNSNANDKVGLIIGARLGGGPYSVRLEGRLIDETAATAEVSYRF